MEINHQGCNYLFFIWNFCIVVSFFRIPKLHFEHPVV